MSADNGIYVAKFSDGHYRITFDSAIENIELCENKSNYYDTLRCYFGSSLLYDNEDDAALAAYKLLKTLLHSNVTVEHGIKYIGEFPYWGDDDEYLGKKKELLDYIKFKVKYTVVFEKQKTSYEPSDDDDICEIIHVMRSFISLKRNRIGYINDSSYTYHFDDVLNLSIINYDNYHNLIKIKLPVVLKFCTFLHLKDECINSFNRMQKEQSITINDVRCYIEIE